MKPKYRKLWIIEDASVTSKISHLGSSCAAELSLMHWFNLRYVCLSLTAVFSLIVTAFSKRVEMISDHFTVTEENRQNHKIRYFQTKPKSAALLPFLLSICCGVLIRNYMFKK